MWPRLEHWTDRAGHARMDMPSRPWTLKTSFHALPTAQSPELCYSWYILFFTWSWVEMLTITLCVIFCLRYIFTAYLLFFFFFKLDMNPVPLLRYPQVKFLPLVSQVVIKPRAVTAAHTHYRSISSSFWTPGACLAFFRPDCVFMKRLQQFPSVWRAVWNSRWGFRKFTFKEVDVLYALEFFLPFSTVFFLKLRSNSCFSSSQVCKKIWPYSLLPFWLFFF